MKNGDCRIPLLESVFEAFPNIPINVDIKTNSDMLIDKVSGVIAKIRFKSVDLLWYTSNFDTRTHMFCLSLSF